MSKKYNSEGINNNTYELLTKDGIFLTESEYGTIENLIIIRMIENYTKEVNKNTLEKLFNKKIAYNLFERNEKTCIHRLRIDDECYLPFYLISENIEEISKELKKELESSQREKKCHSKSISIGASLTNSKVLTGILKLGKQYVLHSVVCVIGTESKKETIIDYTRNLIIEKQRYIELFEFNILNELDSKYLLDDLELLKKYGLSNISSKLYLVFRDEIINNLSKNNFLISDDENNRKIKRYYQPK